MKFIPTLLSLFVFLFSTVFTQQEPDTTKSNDEYLLRMADSLFYETDEVVVTGTRIQKKIIDIPYSVVRISNMQYKYERKVSIGDVLNFVPGVFLQSRYGNHDVRISIRGFGSRSNTGIRGVRILLDGIPESEPDGQTRIEAIDFNSIGSIEIVKGNSSSLYTNAPGGVVNFINDINFPRTFALNFNDFGAYNLRRNGVKAGIRTDDYGLLTTYTYHNSNGFRAHSEDYWHIFNTVYELFPGENSNFQLLGYFVNGLIRLPGSLTKEEFEENHLQAAQRELDFDFRRITKKGRIAIRYLTKFGKNLNNEIEITPYGTIKYFERTGRTYRIMNRYGLGSTIRFLNKSTFFGRQNEFAVGGDTLYQTGPIEEYRNVGGRKDDVNIGITDETIGNSGIYILNNFEILKNKMSLMLSGRYDNVYFYQKDQLLESRNALRRFEAVTPKAALNFKITPSVALYTSFGLSFDSPAGNELPNYPTSSDPGVLLNPDLEPQKSKNFELGLKGHLIFPERNFLRTIFFETTFFNSIIDDEIIPFEVFSDVFFRNSAQTIRRGLETGLNIEILNGFRAAVSYTFSDFNYENYITETIDIQDGQIVTEEKDFSGNNVPSIPEHNLLLSLSYERNISGYITGFGKISYQSVSGMYVDDQNSDKTDSYQLLNSTFGLDFQFNRFNLRFSGGVNNLLDLKYVGFININSTSLRFYEAGEPRSVFVSVNLGYTF
ncbi:MAG: TonB-dependent receptor [Ignavibacteriaceae bacterium]